MELARHGSENCVVTQFLESRGSGGQVKNRSVVATEARTTGSDEADEGRGRGTESRAEFKF
jgi:hypothetical protein